MSAAASNRRSEPDERRFVDDICVSFAMYCDERGYTREQGVTLAERIASDLEGAAEFDREYAPIERTEE